MKLYYLPGACSLVPHAALEWVGLPYEAQAQPREALKSPEYLAINPSGSVPALMDGDFVLTQNVAILSYLNMKFPEKELFGSSSVEGIARGYRWLAFLNADVHKAFSPLFHAPAYAQEEPVKSQAEAASRATIMRLLAQAEAQLGKQAYLGDAVSVADIYLYVILRWSKKLQLDLSTMPHLLRHYETIGAFAPVARAVAAEGLPQ